MDVPHRSSQKDVISELERREYWLYREKLNREGVEFWIWSSYGEDEFSAYIFIYSKESFKASKHEQ